MLLNLVHAALFCSILSVVNSMSAAPMTRSETRLPPSPFNFIQRGSRADVLQPQKGKLQSWSFTSAALGPSDHHTLSQNFPSTENRHEPMSRVPLGRRQPDGTGLDFSSSVKFVPMLRMPTQPKHDRPAYELGRSKSQKLKDLEFGTTVNFRSLPKARGAFTPGETSGESIDLHSPGFRAATSLYKPRDQNPEQSFSDMHFGTSAFLDDVGLKY